MVMVNVSDQEKAIEIAKGNLKEFNNIEYILEDDFSNKEKLIIINKY